MYQNREHLYEVMYNRLNIYNSQTLYDEGYDVLLELLDSSTDMMFGLPHRGTQEELYGWIQNTLTILTPMIHNVNYKSQKLTSLVIENMARYA
jgi:hypothetical protein